MIETFPKIEFLLNEGIIIKPISSALSVRSDLRNYLFLSMHKKLRLFHIVVWVIEILDEWYFSSVTIVGTTPLWRLLLSSIEKNIISCMIIETVCVNEILENNWKAPIQKYSRWVGWESFVVLLCGTSNEQRDTAVASASNNIFDCFFACGFIWIRNIGFVSKWAVAWTQGNSKRNRNIRCFLYISKKVYFLLFQPEIQICSIFTATNYNYLNLLQI